MRIQFSVSAHKFSNFLMLKTYFHYINEKDEAVSLDYASDADDLPEDFISSDYHRKQFDRAIGLIADDLVQNL